MAKLTRLTGKLFGETATATGDNPQIGQFGSGLVGTYVGTTDVATIQNLAAWSNGFIGCVTPSTQYPPLPEMTGFGKVLSYQENYLLQQGIPEWDSATDYHINGYCSYNGVIYKSLTNNNLNNNPASSTANWVEYTPSELNNLANKDLSNLTATGENHFANLSLSNLTSTGDSRLHALKGYADKGELLTDSEGLADVKNYAHSTFDKSKFTKQGSLNITSDGLASGFNGGNYIKTNTSIPVDKDFVLRFEYTVTANFLTKYNSNQQYVIGGTYNSENDVVPILFEHTNSANKIVRFILVLNNSGSNQTETLNSSQFNIALGDVIRAELSRKNGTYTAKYYKNGVQIGNNVASLSTNNLVFESNLIIGQYKSNWANQAFAGSTDLKQFSITVDGVEVFSGNKTGVDTVKADDYTKVGSPTITDDGILTGYSTSNYLKKSVSITGNEIIVKCGFKILESMPVGDQYNILQSVDGTAKIYLSVRNVSGVYKTAVYIGDGTTNGFSGIQDLSVGVYYLTVMTFNIANHTNTTKMYTLDGTLVGTNSYTLPNALSNWTSISELQIGNTNTNAEVDVDLNSIEVYSNGSLVYQPCLKIPFTESKTGSKIVNSIYRDRVNDMASQFGYAPYYTLLEEDTGRYTVVGSPTISSDFVASGLDTSNYLYITPEQKSYNNLIINFNYVYSASGNINAYGTIGNFYQIYNNGTGASELKLITYESGNAVPKTITINGMTQTVGVEYNVKIIINNLNVRYSVTNLSTGVEVHNDTTLNEAFTIGSGFPKALVLYNVQSADYKKAYIIADGNTYKAVEPPDFTLPQGEVYGLIEKVPRQIIYEANWDDYAANTKYTFDLTSEYISDIDVTHWNIEVWAKIKTTAVGGFNAGAVFLLSSQNQYGGTDQYEHGVGIIIENKVLTMWTGQLVNMRSGNGANYNNVQLKIVIKAMEEI